MSKFSDAFNSAGGGAELLADHFGTSAALTLLGQAEKTITVRFSPDEVLPSYYPDGEQVVHRGVARVDPDDWSPVTLERDQIVIAGRLYVPVRIGTQAPVLELQLLAREGVKVEQEGRTVKR